MGPKLDWVGELSSLVFLRSIRGRPRSPVWRGPRLSTGPFQENSVGGSPVTDRRQANYSKGEERRASPPLFPEAVGKTPIDM